MTHYSVFRSLGGTNGRVHSGVSRRPAQDGATLIVQFDDSSPDSAAWYDVTLVGASVGVLPELSIQVASVALSFPTEINRMYQLQYATSLSATNWMPVGAPIQGAGSNVVIMDPILNQPNKVYRVVPLP